MSLSIIILAAGQGTRMRSSLPKVLHPVGGKPLLQHVLETAHAFAGADVHVVIGHGAEQVREHFRQADVHWVVQAEQLGTGHAVAQVLPQVPRENTVLVMYGDVPLVRRQTLDDLQVIASQDAVGLLTRSAGSAKSTPALLPRRPGACMTGSPPWKMTMPRESTTSPM
jgi:bifunctional UDP-N-acetylglucosamine pyrophosphorylase/glucosamine-1-phosphate N-acetyltransferase